MKTVITEMCIIGEIYTALLEFAPQLFERGSWWKRKMKMNIECN